MQKGRSLLVSTSVVSSSTQCFISDTTLTACAARRKRNLILEDSEGLSQENIITSHPGRWKCKHICNHIRNNNSNVILRMDEEVDSGLEDGDGGSVRDGRFLLYWHTTTSTSYTATSTLASLACTPSGFSLSLCG